MCLTLPLDYGLLEVRYHGVFICWLVRWSLCAVCDQKNACGSQLTGNEELENMDSNANVTDCEQVLGPSIYLFICKTGHRTAL